MSSEAVPQFSPFPQRHMTIRLPSLPFERNLMAAAVFLLLLSLPLLMLMLADTRMVDGVSTWLKPWKFCLSFSLHLASMALFWPWLSPVLRTGWKASLIIRLLLATSFFEVAYMASQAALGEGSHYNVATAYTRLMFPLMGVGAVIFVVLTFTAGVSVLRSPGGGDPILRRAIALGLMLSGGLGLVTGVVLAENGGHLVGASDTLSDVVPLFGWSRDVGDLRISHFIGLHALQALPLAGWVASRTLDRPGRRA